MEVRFFSSFYTFFEKSASNDESIFSVVSNFVLWKDLYLLYRLSTLLLLVVTYLEVRSIFSLLHFEIDDEAKYGNII